MPPNPPPDVIVADRWNVSGGTKAWVGFTCSHPFPDSPDDPDTDPEMSGPLFYGRVQNGRSAIEYWSGDAGAIASYMGSVSGVTVTAEQVAAMNEVAANADCA